MNYKELIKAEYHRQNETVNVWIKFLCISYNRKLLAFRLKDPWGNRS